MITKMKKPTVTVAVSAFNEEKNITEFLKSVLAQKEEGFKLEKILVVSDGSSDKTARTSKTFDNRKIIVKDYKKRTGKSTRLNEIYSNLESDILVQSDVDVIFTHSFVVRDIIQPILEDESVGMCGGNTQPLPGETFTEKAVNCTHEMYKKYRDSVRNGDNLFSVDGRILAFRQELAKKIQVPADMITNDIYTYFCCITSGYQYKYVPQAIVNFRSPQTLGDQIKQNTRYLAYPARMARYFPKELVEKERYIPSLLLLKEMAIQFLKHPILCSYIFLVNRYCQLKARKTEKQMTALWQIASTTKVLNQLT